MMRRSLEGIPRAFWQKARGAAARLLMLDYDGTLAPFRIDRMGARPMPRALDALRSVTASPATRVAIVSGRPVAELQQLLGALQAILVGEHGWEWREPGESLVRYPLPEGTHNALQAVLARAAGKGLADQLEVKRTSLVLHTRGLPTGECRRLRRTLEDLAMPEVTRGEVYLSSVSAGLEVRSPGRDKGSIVQELIARCSSGTYPVYIGDDATDEDAFRAIRSIGFGIQVGAKKERTLARGRLVSWEDVPSFLARWLYFVEGGSSQFAVPRDDAASTRLVLVSNRLPRFSTGASGAPLQSSPGGLASALLGSLQNSDHSLWFGWNGRIAEPGRQNRVTKVAVRTIELAGMPMSQTEVNDYYLGYCNELLWPLFHSFQSKVKIRQRHLKCARQVQERFAAALQPMLRKDDLVWVHDYHLLEFGRELKRLGWTGPTGFFLHIPFPAHDLLQILPDPRDLLEAMVEYEVIGFHVEGFLDNYVYACRRELKADWDGKLLSAGGRVQRVIACPVGIDPDGFLPGSSTVEAGEPLRTLMSSLRGRSLILGVDRLDYTKGVPQRIMAFERFIRENPEWRKKVVYVQVASPSREGVEEYADQRKRVESLIGRVNGELGEHDWVPIWYLYRSYSREFLAQLYRTARVGLVTPLRDGMNLVAKEFVAAQSPDSPGVLVLSRTAGAAQQMNEAVIVNPFDPADVSRAIRTALAMPLEERRERHAALRATVVASTADVWSRTFVGELESIRAARTRIAGRAAALPD